MRIIFTVNKEDKDDDVEIISTEDEKIKLIGEIFSNDSCRKILKLISDDNEMTANEIAQKNNMSLTLTIYHLKRMQTAGMIKITRTGISAKGQEMKYYAATNQSFLITPKKSTHLVIESLKKVSKFAAIGMAGLVSWMILKPDGSDFQMQPIHDAGQTDTITADISAADESDTWTSSSEQPVVRMEDMDASVISAPEPQPEPAPSHSGVQDFNLQADSDFANTGSVSLDRTVYPEPFSLSAAESTEPFIFSIIIPIAVIVGGIFIERLLSLWFDKRKQNKMRGIK